ncbi:uncharacterized protein LOC144873116 [Branchiostoma floridae x Branchiostoma japonicum]
MMSIWTFQGVLMDRRNIAMSRPVSLVAFLVCAVFPTVLSEVCEEYERTSNGHTTSVDSFSCPTNSDQDKDSYCCMAGTLKYCCDDCTQSLSLTCAAGSSDVNLSMGAIVGIAVSAVVCVVLLAAIIALCCSFCCEKKLRSSQISVQPAAYPQPYHGQGMYPMEPLQPPPYVPAESPPPYTPQGTATQQNTTSFTQAEAGPDRQGPPGAALPARQAPPPGPPPQYVSVRQRQATGSELPPYDLTQVG